MRLNTGPASNARIGGPVERAARAAHTVDGVWVDEVEVVDVMVGVGVIVVVAGMHWEYPGSQAKHFSRHSSDSRSAG